MVLLGMVALHGLVVVVVVLLPGTVVAVVVRVISVAALALKQSGEA